MLESRPKRDNRREYGAKPASRRWYLYGLVMVAVALLAAGGAALYHLRPLGDTTTNQLVTIGEGFVRTNIADGLKTSFSDENETRVEALPDQKFLIAGWVDLITEDGQVERRSFSCVIYKDSSDTWVGEKISMIPQQL